MFTHEQKIQRIATQLKEHKDTKPVSLKKKSVSHEVPKLKDKRRLDKKIDLSNLNEILLIDPQKQICIAEAGVTFVELVSTTLKYGLVPIIVPELKTITVGGAVAGCSIESMSYKYSGFHDTCLEYEIITAKGEILTCTPANENNLIFHMVHGTFGTLGIISKLKFRLIKAQPFVRVRYEKYGTLEEYKDAIWRHFCSKDVDFMDGIIHASTEYILSVADFVAAAPYTNRYDWTKVYYRSTAERKEDYLRTTDYFFRYDRGVTNVMPKSFVGRLLFGKFMDSTRTLRIANLFHRLLPAGTIPITLDTFIPFSRFTEFMDWYEKEVNHFPLWCVPYRSQYYEWLADDFLKNVKDNLFLDIAIYGMIRNDGKNYYKMIEDKLMEIGGLKTLISSNYYTEENFWEIWNKKNYYAIKRITDPDNIFRNLYTKTCKTMRGLNE